MMPVAFVPEAARFRPATSAIAPFSPCPLIEESVSTRVAPSIVDFGTDLTANSRSGSQLGVYATARFRIYRCRRSRINAHCRLLSQDDDPVVSTRIKRCRHRRQSCEAVDRRAGTYIEIRTMRGPPMAITSMAPWYNTAGVGASPPPLSDQMQIGSLFSEQRGD